MPDNIFAQQFALAIGICGP